MSNLTSGSRTEAFPEYLSEAAAQRIVEILSHIVIPVVSALGVVGNAFSMRILLQHGLHTSSKIILFVLAINDTVVLLTSVYVPQMIKRFYGGVGYQLSMSLSWAWFLFDLIVYTLCLSASYVAMEIPMMITIERLIAVFLPLRFPQIVTPFRVWFTLGLIYTFVIVYFTQWAFHYEFYSEFVEASNKTIGRVRLSPYLRENHLVLDHLDKVVDLYMSKIIPPIFTAIGSVIIFVKIKITSMNRKKLTSSSSAISTSQTTRVLLAVCGVYVIVCSAPLVEYIPQAEGYFYHFTDGGRIRTNIGFVFSYFTGLAHCINSTYNFVVYVGMNRKFRMTFKSLFQCVHVHEDTQGKDNRITISENCGRSKTRDTVSKK